MDDLNLPFCQVSTSLQDSQLRETAYEIFVGSCRSSGVKPLTYIPQSEKFDRSDKFDRSVSSLQRSISTKATSKVKKALGLTKKSTSSNLDSGNDVRSKRPVTVGELMRVQMRVSQQTDSRIRRGLLRVSAGQIGRRFESMVLPLELLHHLKPSDFPSRQEYLEWQTRILKVLEAGLLMYPRFSLEKTDASSRCLEKIIHAAFDVPINTVISTESIQSLQSIVTSLACRSFGGSVSGTCHWADGFPLNISLYKLLLEACFDADDQTLMIDEVDEVLELIKKTWEVLGMNQIIHDVCFAWVLFRSYIVSGQVENDLLFAANNVLAEVETDIKTMNDPNCSKILSSITSSILRWTDKKLSAYHDDFYNGSVDSMLNIVSLAISSAKILAGDMSHYTKKDGDVARNKIDSYIRSAMCGAFAQKLEKANESRHSSRKGQNLLPFLTSLAQDISELAFNEKEIFSPMLKKWHPNASSVAVATLHSCYGKELKKYVSGLNELTPDAVHVLLAAEMLEKSLVQIAVEDSADSEDGGKAIIREMHPYEAESVISWLVKSWIQTRVDRMKEWVDRNLQQEAWSPKANKWHIGPSSVEILRTIDETLEAFFLLPIPMHPLLLPDLVNGFDRCLQHYILKAKSGCGTRNEYLPTLPALTRCKTGSKYRAVYKKEPKKSHNGSHNATSNVHTSPGMQQLCIRINTLQHIRKEAALLNKKALSHLESSGYRVDDPVKRFDLSEASCHEGIQQLCEVTAYKIVFLDLSYVLFDGLYVREVSYSRIEQFLYELEQNLEIVSTTVHDRARTRIITDMMRASFDGFLLVLLSGGISRAFTQQDSIAIEEDFKLLKDLFWSNGDGLPRGLIDRISGTVEDVLPLFHANTESLIEQLRHASLETGTIFGKSKIPAPPTSCQWNSKEPNTILRVLCHRNDETATKFLKKTYDLSSKH